jgi:hypothetical protein
MEVQEFSRGDFIRFFGSHVFQVLERFTLKVDKQQPYTNTDEYRQFFENNFSYQLNGEMLDAKNKYRLLCHLQSNQWIRDVPCQRFS